MDVDSRRPQPTEGVAEWETTPTGSDRLDGCARRILTRKPGELILSAEMTADTKAAVQRAVQELRACGAQEVYLFGSVAAGRAGQTSDLDLAVRGLPRRWFYRAVGRVMRAAGRPVDLVDLDSATPFSVYLQEQGGLVRVS